MFKEAAIGLSLAIGLLLVPHHKTDDGHHNHHIPVQVDQFSASSPEEAAQSRSEAIQAQYGLSPDLATQIATASPQRRSVVLTALGYVGTPYALWGSTHDSMDCSGLTMVSYATVGIGMAHYVPSQDNAAPVRLAPGQQAVGDLLVFDDQDHVAIYVGDGLLIQAPDYGIPVQVVPVSNWVGVSWHVARYLP